MLKIETKELKISELKRKIEIIGRFTNTTPIISNDSIKILQVQMLLMLCHISSLLKIINT